MGASVQPQQVDPADIARVQANVAKMRAQNAPESDVLAYLQHEDEQSRLAPSPDTSLSLRNIGRSVTQGATFGWGDELGLTDRAKEKAFKSEHPIVDFLSKMGGGVLAPAAAVMAAPALGTTLGGAALLGGTAGLLSGAGEAEGGLAERAKGGAIGGLLGSVGGAAGYGVAKGAGAVAGTVLDRMHPERAVARAASKLIDPSVAARLALVDGIAPGGASIGTATLAEKGAGGTGAKLVSRMLPTLRGTGASPEAAASTEGSLIGQTAALETAKKALGKQMSAITGDVPVTPRLETVVGKVRDVLGGSKTPLLPGAKDPQVVDVQDLRRALSDLRDMGRALEKQGVNANGMTVKDVGDAQGELQRLIYDHFPAFEHLDRPYAIASEQQRITDKAIKQVQTSRAAHAGNAAYGSTAGSLGGSLPKGAHGVVMGTLDKLLTNKAGAADAVARLIAKPGGPEMVQNLLNVVPKASTGRGSKAAVAGMSAAIPAMKGLLFSSDSP